MALTELQVGTLVQRYLRERDRFEKLASTVARLLSARLRDAAVPHVPTFRSKEPESLRSKLARDSENHELADFEEDFSPSVIDLAGVRVLLYRPADMGMACDLVEEAFALPPGARYRKDYDKPDGYRARHRIVTLRDDQISVDPAMANLGGVLCEIQIVTIADHIWNELEHDILYKTPDGHPSDEQRAYLRALRTQLNSVHENVAALMEATDRRRAANLTVIDTPEDLQRALRERCQRTVVGDLSRLLDLLAGVLRDVTPASLASLPIDPDTLDRAVAEIATAGTQVPSNDVRAVVAALWPAFGQDFLEIVQSWRGRPGPVSRFVQGIGMANRDPSE